MPGDDLPTILINVRNDVMRVTRRRQVPWEHSAMTARFYFIPPKPAGYEVELDFWASVKDSTSPAVLGTYLERYPNGEFAPIAQALMEHYQRQLKAELAAREEARRREEEERKSAEVKRLEEERRAREAAIAEERKRAEEAKSAADITRLDEQAKSEWRARTEELRKAAEEARLAREAAAAAEKQRLAAVKAAEDAAKAAEQTITAKREAEKTGDPLKIAALPKLEAPKAERSFDGVWLVNLTCPRAPDGANTYSKTFIGRVKDGTFRAEYGVKGTFKWLSLEGEVRSGGKVHITAKGTVSNSKSAVDRSKPGTPYTYVVIGQFEGTRGYGKRHGGRECDLVFTKQ